MEAKTPTVVLLDLSKGKHFVFTVAWQIFERGRGRHKLYLVLLADNLAHVLRLQILFANVAGLVIEEAV